MSIEQVVQELGARVRNLADRMQTEEAVKTSVVLPFLQSLGYDVFNPDEVIPEFTADAVGKKGEKVDYAIKLDDAVRILIECKGITTKLDRPHLAQLYRYFSVTKARFAILTNGRVFQFYSDLEEPNKLDSRPFFTFDISEATSAHLAEIRKFRKADFDVDGILANAERLKYTSYLKAEIGRQIEDPSEDLVRLIASSVHDGRFTSAVVEQFRGLVRTAFREVIRDAVQERLSSALEQTSSEAPAPESLTVETPSDIVTTEEELHGFHAVKAIAAEAIRPGRIFMRDQKTYCGVLIDDNNRKPLVRLHFNRSKKYLGLFDGDNEERVEIAELDDIYQYAERIRATARKHE